MARDLRTLFHAMYREILEYEGNFGDPIEVGFDPFEEIQREPPDEEHRIGVGVALLCSLRAAIDNSTHPTVLDWPFGRRARLLQRERPLREVPLLERAFDAFFESESAFDRILWEVYLTIVLPRARRSGPA